MRLPLLSALALLLTACASQTKSTQKEKRTIVDEVREENISTQTVLDLARSSYLKGCVDGKKLYAPELETSSFERCKEHAFKHQKEIRSIIEQ